VINLENLPYKIIKISRC